MFRGTAFFSQHWRVSIKAFPYKVLDESGPSICTCMSSSSWKQGSEQVLCLIVGAYYRLFAFTNLDVMLQPKRILKVVNNMDLLELTVVDQLRYAYRMIHCPGNSYCYS